MKRNRSGVRAALLAAVLLLFPVRAQAQSPTGTAPPTVTLLRPGVMGELLAVYIPRSNEIIERSLGFARDHLIVAAGELETARRLSLEAEGRVRVIKEEIQTTKVRRNVAKKAKNDALRSELDEAVKQQEREQDYLKRMHESMKADTDRLEAEETAADTWVKALELESMVSRRHAELSVGDPASDAVDDYEQRLRQMLEARRLAADRARKASEKRKVLAERRLKQLESLSKLTN